MGRTAAGHRHGAGIMDIGRWSLAFERRLIGRSRRFEAYYIQIKYDELELFICC